jgi:hypothetical protein
MGNAPAARAHTARRALCYSGSRSRPADRIVMDLDVEALKEKIAALKAEHTDLDEAIDRLAEKVPFNNLNLQRLKKRRLALRDLITKLESNLLPDIIA